MTFTVTYRAKDGALREERVEAANRAECVAECHRRGMSNLIGLYMAKHVVTELLRAAEEVAVVFREPHATVDLAFKQAERAYEVCHLEESVFTGFNGLRELNGTWQGRRGDALEKVGDGLLPAIVIDLYAPVCGEHIPVAGGEVGELSFKGCCHLRNVAGISLVDGKAMVGEVYLTRESHHAVEYPAAQVAGHEAESVVAVQNGSGVEAQVLDADFLKPACKLHRRRFYRKPLVVHDKSKNVEPRCRGWFAKDSGLVHEQTQCVALRHLSVNKSDGNRFPSLKAEDFPRITTTPILRSTSEGSITNRQMRCKRELWEFENVKCKVKDETKDGRPPGHVRRSTVAEIPKG